MIDQTKWPEGFVPHPSSFRDPSGCVVLRDGEILRVIARKYREDYELLRKSGLYDGLVAGNLLIEHFDSNAEITTAFKVLKPRQLNFISYPYEWCFSALRDAAMVTLQAQEEAVLAGMTLKDASAFNIQFVDGKPMLIDLLSFERLQEKPWAAYGQFCRHFLAPLALMAYRDGRLGQMMREHLDGIPLDLASKLLPLKSRLSPSLFLHLHLHAASARFGAKTAGKKVRQQTYSKKSLLGLVRTLRSAVAGLRYTPGQDVWANYYSETVTGGGYVEGKQRLVEKWLSNLKPQTVWDLGANTGAFSRIATGCGAETIAFDGDIDCVETCYRELSKRQESKLLPLYLDLVNPSPALGWAHEERDCWMRRAQPDLILALALIHHLAIGNNLPLQMLAEFFARLCPILIIEFVPKDDPNAKKLLDVRNDIFETYTQECFEAEFSRRFAIRDSAMLPNSHRKLYLMERHAATLSR